VIPKLKKRFGKVKFSSNCIKIVHPLYQKRTISYSIGNYCIVNHLYFNPACDWGIFSKHLKGYYLPFEM